MLTGYPICMTIVSVIHPRASWTFDSFGGKSRLQGPLVVRLGAMWTTELVMFCTVSDPRAFEGLPIIWAVPKQWWAWNKNQQHSDTEYWTFFFCGGHHFQLYPDLDHFWLWQLQILRVPSCKSHYPRPEVSSEPDACFDAGDILWHPQINTPVESLCDADSFSKTSSTVSFLPGFMQISKGRDAGDEWFNWDPGRTRSLTRMRATIRVASVGPRLLIPCSLVALVWKMNLVDF